jgi:hypothetical protein
VAATRDEDSTGETSVAVSIGSSFPLAEAIRW